MKDTKNKLKHNIVYKISYEIMRILLPLITSPYISRVIGAEGLGIYSYTYSIAYYFVLFSMLGIYNYGNRAIAQTRENQSLLDMTFSGILIIHIIISLIISVLYVFTSLFSKEYKVYLLLQSFFVISALFDVSWFYFGIEQFKMTVLRDAGVKSISVILIFVFVHNREDLWKYILIMSLSSLFSQLVLWIPICKHVHIVKQSFRNIVKHIKPLVVLFIPAIAVSLYKFMDKIMLGAINSRTELGIYENAEKICNIPITVIAAFGGVMLPRMSNIMHNKQLGLASEYIEQSMRYVMCLAFALSFGLAAVSKTFAPVFWGSEFVSSGIIIIGLSITIPFISFANVIRTQYLIPAERDKEYLVSVISGAIVNLIINSLLIRKLGALGATIGTIAAEVIVCIIQVVTVRNEIAIKRYIKNAIPFFILGIIMLFVVLIIGEKGNASIVTLLLQVATGVLVYGIGASVYLYSIKDSLFTRFVRKVLTNIHFDII